MILKQCSMKIKNQGWWFLLRQKDHNFEASRVIFLTLKMKNKKGCVVGPGCSSAVECTRAAHVRAQVQAPGLKRNRGMELSRKRTGSQSSNVQVGNALLDHRSAESSLDTLHRSGQGNQCSFQVSLENPSDPPSAFFTSPPLQL